MYRVHIEFVICIQEMENKTKPGCSYLQVRL